MFPEHIVAFDWQNSPSQGMAVRSESSDSLRTNAVPAVLAFDYKQDGSNSGADVSPTLLATPHDQSHANGGGQLAVCVTGERTHALTSEGADASEDGTGRGTPIVARYVRSDHYEAASVGSTLAARDSRGPQDLVTAGIPRRLTPRECERLMGWEDDWTRYGVDEDGRRYELSDSARYRICGNGIGAPHTHWIGLRFLAAWQRLSTIHQERAA